MRNEYLIITFQDACSVFTLGIVLKPRKYILVIKVVMVGIAFGNKKLQVEILN